MDPGKWLGRGGRETEEREGKRKGGDGNRSGREERKGEGFHTATAFPTFKPW